MERVWRSPRAFTHTPRTRTLQRHARERVCINDATRAPQTHATIRNRLDRVSVGEPDLAGMLRVAKLGRLMRKHEHKTKMLIEWAQRPRMRLRRNGEYYQTTVQHDHLHRRSARRARCAPIARHDGGSCEIRDLLITRGARDWTLSRERTRAGRRRRTGRVQCAESEAAAIVHKQMVQACAVRWRGERLGWE
eukprot:554454-Pleurochrysis_carterae.AAC.2